MKYTDEQLDYMMGLYSYGPFTIPERDKWLLVGNGPTANKAKGFLAENPGCGTITFNHLIEIMDFKTTIHFMSHYEATVIFGKGFEMADIVYLANPMHVGYRCLPIDTANLYNYDYIVRYFPNKIRFFRKEPNMNKIYGSPDSLYAYHTIATSGLHLLSRNGINKVYSCGIDGGFDRSDLAKGTSAYKYSYATLEKATSFAEVFNYDRCKKDFIDLADYLKVEVEYL